MPSDPKALPQAVEVAVVGGGPAGLAAATRLKQRGVASLAVLDREPQAGGIPRHCGHYPFGLREFHRLLRGPDYARRLVDRAEAASVDIYPQTTVTAIAPGPKLSLSTPQGRAELTAKKVLLATGVRETSRAARFIGGQRPLGVISTGALQSMVYLAGKRPFARPVILGSELVSFSAILTCRHAGIRPVAMIEPGARITARSFVQVLPRLFGIPLHLDTQLLAIHGKGRVEGVTLRGPAVRNVSWTATASSLPALSRRRRRSAAWAIWSWTAAAAAPGSISSGAAPTRTSSPPATCCARWRPRAGAGRKASPPATSWPTAWPADCPPPSDTWRSSSTIRRSSWRCPSASPCPSATAP